VTRPFVDYAGTTHTLAVPSGNGPATVDVTLSRDHLGVLREVFIRGARIGTAETNALGRLLSLALQHDVPPDALVRTLSGIGGEHAAIRLPGGQGLVTSLPDAIARLLAEGDGIESPR